MEGNDASGTAGAAKPQTVDVAVSWKGPLLLSELDDVTDLRHSTADLVLTADWTNESQNMK